jgi:hypothetical protein
MLQVQPALRGTMRRTFFLLAGPLALALHLGCGGNASGGSSGSDHTTYPPTDPSSGPAAGWSGGNASAPSEALAEDVSTPDHVVGTGTPDSCTAADVIAKVALGGKITFNCGAAPVTIKLTNPIKIYNDKPNVVIDGGGLVTLSGSGTTRILYMNTCDESLVWTTDHCDNQETPQLAVQSLTFIDGNATADSTGNHLGGGAIYASGGRLKIVDCRFFNNRIATTGPDTAGAAIYAFEQYNDQPVYVVHSTFGGAEGYGNSGSNGGALGSIGVSWSIYNSVFSYNTATGNGGNPEQSGTPGGGSGGAIYNDGNNMKLSIYGSLIEHNTVKQFASAIFFVADNNVGTVLIHDSTLQQNTGGTNWEIGTCPGVSILDGTVTDFENNVHCE